MYIRNPRLSLGFKLALVLIGLYGLTLLLGLFTDTVDWGVLNYFTTLSNIFCVIYFAVDLVYIIRNHSRTGKTTWSPRIKGIAMMSITVTMLVYHFMLAGAFSMGGSMRLSLVITHYIIPGMTILDWLLFDKKGQMKKTSPLLWATAPLAYFLYAVIAAQLGGGIGHNSRYPYPFMDVDALGWGKVLSTVLILGVFFLGLGYVYYTVDHNLRK